MDGCGGVVGRVRDGLRIAAHADPTLRSRVGALLADADWSYCCTPYDPADPVAGPGQLSGGYWPDKPGKGEPTGHHYGALNTEPRMASHLRKERFSI